MPARSPGCRAPPRFRHVPPRTAAFAQPRRRPELQVDVAGKDVLRHERIRARPARHRASSRAARASMAMCFSQTGVGLHRATVLDHGFLVLRAASPDCRRRSCAARGSRTSSTPTAVPAARSSADALRRDVPHRAAAVSLRRTGRRDVQQFLPHWHPTRGPGRGDAHECPVGPVQSHGVERQVPPCSSSWLARTRP